MATNVNDTLVDGIVRGMRVANHRHASSGGRAYPKEVREMVLQMILDGGIDAIKTPEVRQLQAQKKFPCLVTCKRWLRLHLVLGHVRPLKRHGNKSATREISGPALFHLAFYRILRPHARLYEVQAYLTNRFPNIDPYSHSQIHRAEDKLGLSRKAASRTSKEAYTPKNLAKRKMYWERNYPFGVGGVDLDDVIDLDEAKFTLVSADRNYGKVGREFWCNLRGNYKKGELGSNLLMAISGDGNNPFSFHKQYIDGGTD